MIDTILQGDVRSCLKQLEDGSVQCVITSPPYWGLRDYGTATWEGGNPNCDHVRAYNSMQSSSSTLGGRDPEDTLDDKRRGMNTPYGETCGKCGARRIDSQIGLEPTPEAYVADLVEVFQEVKRVLRNDGVLWLNLGDSYASETKGTGGSGVKSGLNCKRSEDGGFASDNHSVRHFEARIVQTGLAPKNLVGIPWMVAFALRADGWYLRSDIIWNKPNPMPESVTDRCTKSHEYIFMLTKSERYFYDAEAIKEPSTESTLERGKYAWHGKVQIDDDGKERRAQPDSTEQMGERWAPENRNKRDVWTVATQPCAEAHFATFPPALIQPMILAGSKTGDTILDPFMGSGTTAIQAVRWLRHYLGCELNSDYVKMAERRIADMVGPLFEVTP